MGNKIGKVQLKEKDVKKYSQSTGFNADEVKALYSTFVCLKSSHDDAKSTEDLHLSKQ